MVRKLIDLPEEIVKLLKHRAVEEGKYLKNLIEEELTKIAKKKGPKDGPLKF